MENLKLLIFSFLGILALTVLIHAQTQSGFISIDCGLPENSAYSDKKTGINYTSDVTFTESGVSYNISSEYNRDTLEQPFLTVRSFPEGTKNCYTLKPAPGDSKFLIRASFMYGNYDGQNKLPSFDLLLGTDVWDSVELADASTIIFKEIIHVSPRNYIDVCLVNKGSGTPFISSLELRPLKNSMYPAANNSGTSLLLYSFKDDNFDRIWSPYSRTNWVTVSSSFKINNVDSMNQPPSMVMQTAAMPANGLDCSYPNNNSLRITSLNLSSSGISGEISPYISGLKLIQSLDLSNNNLTGPVPDFQLPFLTVLVDGNPDLCLSTSCTQKKKTVVIPVLASFLAVSVLIAAALSILWILKARIQESHLLDEGSSTADILSWGGRLRIATETAQGLEYLHSGCTPGYLDPE
ncbi:hypothetical protein Q3G72_014974 [Acer saccharum]|nr:hypothetical protein Q3G72_014974 [Acer saccharum]